jgi:3-hydroxybutyryl-CoA dehydrogenase
LHETLAIAGAGTIACGLAATAARHGQVVLWARSDGSAERARATVDKLCEKLGEPESAAQVRIETDRAALHGETFIVEAVVEDPDHKTAVLSELGQACDEEAILATTTSSLSIEMLAHASGRPERFVGLHVFNPVPRMELVELVFPSAASQDVRARARTLCEELGKTPVEVPDTPGFVVNRLLFPYLFDAVELMSRTGIGPEEVDRCMTLGAGQPMGPLALLDFVGLDVAVAIGETIGLEVPARLQELVSDGALGRKARRGFYSYE